MSGILSEVTVAALFHHAEASLAWGYLSSFRYPWEALAGLGAEILRLGEGLPVEAYEERAPGIWVSKRATVAAAVSIAAPAIIGHGAELRQGAFLRGGTLVGEACVVGNSTELKNCILFNGAQVPHYNYVGDSILGYRAHMGAGAVTSNVKGDRSPVTVRVGEQGLETGLVKCGAMLGDYAEIGCHAVLNPGSVIGVGSRVYPLVSVRGYLPHGTLCKSADRWVKKI